MHASTHCMKWRGPQYSNHHTPSNTHTERLRLGTLRFVLSWCSGGGDVGGSFNNDDVNSLCRNPYSWFHSRFRSFMWSLMFYTFAPRVRVCLERRLCSTTIVTTLEFFGLLLLGLFGYVNLIDWWRILLRLAVFPNITHFNGMPPQLCPLSKQITQTWKMLHLMLSESDPDHR